MHFNLYDAVAAAGFTAAALYVKTEPAFAVSPCFCIRRRCKQIPYLVENTRIGRRIGTGRPADRGLVNCDDFIELVDAKYALMFSRYHPRSVQVPCQAFV